MKANVESPEAFKQARVSAGVTAAQLAAAIRDHAARKGVELSLSQQAISFFETGKAKTRPLWLSFAAEVFERGTRFSRDTADEPLEDDEIASVPIQQIDFAYGMGATYADGPVSVEVLRFPKVWIEAITTSPPELLTWARGRGDSMAPTIQDGDPVLIDRSQRRITNQDTLWAYTVGDLGAIKRLRVKGDRVVILSDNPSVPPDEEPIDLVNIVGRVINVVKRL